MHHSRVENNLDVLGPFDFNHDPNVNFFSVAYVALVDKLFQWQNEDISFFSVKLCNYYYYYPEWR